MAARAQGQAAAEDDDRRASMLDTIADLVVSHLPLSIQALTIPALSKAWGEWAGEQRAKERALERKRAIEREGGDDLRFNVTMWVAQRQLSLSDEQRRRYQHGAVAHGDTSAVMWFSIGLAVDGDRVKHQKRLCAWAARGGQLQALQWLHANGCSCDSRTCSWAARGGHLAVLQWPRANGCDWDAWTSSQAALTGHLAVLQWARANGCAWDAHTCSAVAGGGHLAVLQWARADGCAWDAQTCSEAARRGHLAVLQWARANGCAWNADTCAVAAQRGHLGVLQWARANGCDWDARTCSAAARGGHVAVLAWARANGCAWDGTMGIDDDVIGLPLPIEWWAD